MSTHTTANKCYFAIAARLIFLRLELRQTPLTWAEGLKYTLKKVLIISGDYTLKTML